MLRARALASFSWDSFECDAIGSSSWAIRSEANQRYVSPEFWYPGAFKGMLRARATSIGRWEQYTFVPVASCACYAIRAANGNYVSAELDDPGLLTGMLRSRARVIGLWQEFDIRQTPRPTVTAIDDGIPGQQQRNVVIGGDGMQVTISGIGFSTATGATSFDFGTANPATDVTCSSTTHCIATVPPAPDDLAPDGLVDVIATVNGLPSLPSPPYDEALYFSFSCGSCGGGD
jgi:hypothetical protein